jgi:hypothetical protein
MFDLDLAIVRPGSRPPALAQWCHHRLQRWLGQAGA